MSEQGSGQLPESTLGCGSWFGSECGGLQGSRAILAVPDPTGRSPCIELSTNLVWILHAMAASGALFARWEHRSS